MKQRDWKKPSERRQLQLGCAGLLILLAVMQTQALTLLEEPYAACLAREVAIVPALQPEDDREYLAWAVQEHHLAAAQSPEVSHRAPQSKTDFPKPQSRKYWRST